MAIWKQDFNLDDLNMMNQNTMGENMGLQFTGIGEDFLEATIPVDHRNHQPLGLLHGGASVALAETLGSVAAHLCIQDTSTQSAVGIEINANHIRSARNGIVKGKVTPIKIGRQIQIWDIEIKDEKNRLVCKSRLTTMTVKLAQ
ncbi:hotdog fold thioesterase [Membranihabitans maritimus]|uniref:hotdog fold thioesterase n=1 Tax=Membranihabitans maritimus TaxID=2904244 RepID=UPI001F02D4B8|nr:hotdog fold thioesterase [Membranihabitans maritimus]